MVGRAIDDKSPDTLVVVSGEGFWTGSSTLPHLHHFFAREGSRRAENARPRTMPDLASVSALSSSACSGHARVLVAT